MPELPEMQALAERLDAALAGTVLAGVEPLQFSALKTVVPPFDALVGRTVGSVGRGHSDDILHEAPLSPYATLASLDADERERLLAAVHTILERALAEERKRTGGLPAKLSDRFVVHGRAGDPCPRCGDDLRRVWYESHEIAYCPTCQTGGKVLADRRLSRIVR